MKLILGLFLLFSCFQFKAQWNMQMVVNLPKKISNSAVVGFQDLIDSYAYTFAGIDSTKLYGGIHLKSYKYSLLNNSWSVLPDLPDTLGKIAASASVVKNKIYIIGGYHVFANGNEVSSNKVHVFNPSSNVFEADAAPCPYGIDDQAQVVWRDSLIFVITGWSNSSNVATVRTFNPSSNQWLSATSVPNTNVFKAFGATAVIVEDTIFYYGGASMLSNFPSNNKLRKGVINPSDPTLIVWSDITVPTSATNYRGAAFKSEFTAYFYGGSNLSYNYNGIPYAGAAQAYPTPTITNFSGNTLNVENVEFGRMDFRGMATLGFNKWLIVGGMDSVKNVCNSALLLSNPTLDLVEKSSITPILRTFNDIWTLEKQKENTQLFDTKGQLIRTFSPFQEIVIHKSDLTEGVYFLHIGYHSIKLVK